MTTQHPPRSDKQGQRDVEDAVAERTRPSTGRRRWDHPATADAFGCTARAALHGDTGAELGGPRTVPDAAHAEVDER